MDWWMKFKVSEGHILLYQWCARHSAMAADLWDDTALHMTYCPLIQECEKLDNVMRAFI